MVHSPPLWHVGLMVLSTLASLVVLVYLIIYSRKYMSKDLLGKIVKGTAATILFLLLSNISASLFMATERGVPSFKLYMSLFHVFITGMAIALIYLLVQFKKLTQEFTFK